MIFTDVYQSAGKNEREKIIRILTKTLPNCDESYLKSV
mgnify:CR=1 FL=1